MLGSIFQAIGAALLVLAALLLNLALGVAVAGVAFVIFGVLVELSKREAVSRGSGPTDS